MTIDRRSLMLGLPLVAAAGTALAQTGNKDTLASATPAQVRAFYEATYSADRMALAARLAVEAASISEPSVLSDRLLAAVASDLGARARARECGQHALSTYQRRPRMPLVPSSSRSMEDRKSVV